MRVILSNLLLDEASMVILSLVPEILLDELIFLLLVGVVIRLVVSYFFQIDRLRVLLSQVVVLPIVQDLDL